MRIGIFGGTFNPVHYGHLRAAEEAAVKFLDKVVFVPAHITLDKVPAQAVNSKLRLEMINIAIKDNRKFESSDIEIKRGGISYSYDTVVQFKKMYPGDELYFIVGEDAYKHIKSWKNASAILNEINFIVVSRSKLGFKNLAKLAGFLPDNLKENIVIDYNGNRFAMHRNIAVYFLKITVLDISSTDIRNNFKNNISNLFLLPNEVIKYIINNKLYS